MFAAQQPVEASAPTAVETLEASYHSAMNDYYAQIGAMYESGEFTEIENPIEIYFDKFRAFAKDQTIAASERARAQIWCVQYFGEKNWSHPDKVFASLSEMFIKEYADSDYAIKFTKSMRRVQLDTPSKIAAIEQLGDATTSKDIQAYCVLACAFAYGDGNDQEKSDSAVDSLLEKYPNSQAAKDAAPLLVKRQLKVDKTAPALSGVDVDGKERHLKDTRGKVTFVVFWGFW